jgi:hypothetical protein
MDVKCWIVFSSDKFVGKWEMGNGKGEMSGKLRELKARIRKSTEGESIKV